MKRTLLTAFFVVLAVDLAWAIYAPPPPGPIGWEKRLTPGFDPPIEYVVVYESWGPGPGKEVDGYITQWGPGAGPVLVALYQNPDWKEFHHQILSVMDKVDAPEVTSFLMEEAKQLASTKEAPPRPDYEKVRLLNMLAKRDAAAADAVAFEIAQNPAHPYFESIIGYLSIRATQENGAACKAKLEELAADTSDARLRDRIERTFKGDAAQNRANEPMSVVLQREAKGEKP